VQQTPIIGSRILKARVDCSESEGPNPKATPSLLSGGFSLFLFSQTTLELPYVNPQ